MTVAHSKHLVWTKLEQPTWAYHSSGCIEVADFSAPLLAL